MLAFQQELLADPELTQPAAAAIADFAAADDDYFRARAADLADLRDRVLDLLGGEPDAASPGDGAEDIILVAAELTPSRFLETDWRRCRGAACGGGSTASHVAMLARARGVPLLVGLAADLAALPDGAEAVLDAETGQLVVHPAAATRASCRARMARREVEEVAAAPFLARPAVTGGGERVRVLVNVDTPEAIEGAVDPAHCDGVGLMRSEFLFRDGVLPDEESQHASYRRVMRWAGGRPVTVRTLDAGGDKPIPGLTPEGEANPFLGLRGVRLSLARPEVFRVQVRALARAAADGPLKVMVPMVTAPREIEAVRALFEAEVADLDRAGIRCRLPAIGMMVEVPAAAIAIERFRADFFSIGSNDLVQYVTATSRDALGQPWAAALYDPLDPAVVALIRRVAAHGRETGREVSLCGDMAGDPSALPTLLDAGLRVLSTPAAALARVKAAIAGYGVPA